MKAGPRERRTELVLVGAGHAHVQVLRGLAMRPLAGVRTTLVVDRPQALYSGMVPGVVSRRYTAEETTIDVVPLARRAGAAVVLAPALRVLADAQRIELEGRPPLPYDLASINIGSTVAGLDLPGVRDHAVPTRPIGRFLPRLDARLAALSTDRPAVAVVGGGAGGIELAFCLEARLRERGLRPELTLYTSSDRLLPAREPAVSEAVAAAARARGLRVRTGTRVAEVGPDHVTLSDGSTAPADLCIWVAGAAAHPLGRASGLPCTAAGFLSVDPSLRVEGHARLFAVGDCAVPTSWPETPRAGVYAVRQGPVLAANLRATLEGRALRPYEPQRDFLTLLNLGDGTAIAARWGRALRGRWAMLLKDRIDRAFMARFQALREDGEAAPAGPPVMGGEQMPCGGCAAKLAEGPLRRALARLPPPQDPALVLGLAQSDDVAALVHGDGLVVTSIDAFPAFTDDPWIVGRAAAINAVSDLRVKGVAPRLALATVELPEDRDGEDVLHQVLHGARAILDPLGCTLAGGHTTLGPRLSVGFAVTGFAADTASLLAVDGAQPGDLLVLTRPLGTGVILAADMQGLARGATVQSVLAHVSTPDPVNGALALAHGAHAATDITGFGLVGHLATLLRSPELAAELDPQRVPVLPGALELLGRGLRSTFHGENRKLAAWTGLSPEQLDQPRHAVLFDPQTAGGALVALPAAAAPHFVAAAREAGASHAQVIGRITAHSGGPRIQVAPSP